MVIPLVLVVLIAVAFGVRHMVEHVLPYAAVRPYRIQTKDIVARYGTDNPLRARGIRVDTFNVKTRDLIELASWFVPCEAARGTVVVMHGIAASKELSWKTILEYHERGYAVIAFDERAHGASGGLNATLGYYEKYDVVDVLNYCETHSMLTQPLIIHGFSMGGAIAIQAAAIEPRIHAAVIVGAFANLRETMYDYISDMTFVRWEYLADHVFRRSELIANFRIDEVRPEFAARSLSIPVLLLHGEEDEKISIDYARRVFQNLQSSDKKLVPIPHGKHLNLGEVGAELTNAEIQEFLQRLDSKWQTN